MALNLSRGKYQNLYSSDRISSLMGNGLLVFLNSKTNFHKLFSNKEVVFYKNKFDLIKKIKFYTKNDKERVRISKNGYNKYHKFMSNIVISKYMMNCVGLNKEKLPFWHNLN